MRAHSSRQPLRWLLLLALTTLLSGCGWFGETTNNDFLKLGNDISVNTRTTFEGKIYFTKDHNLYVLNGQSGELKQLTSNQSIYDPAVSPDGKWIACIVREKSYSSLVLIPTDGSPQKVLRGGQGDFYANPPYTEPKNSFAWYGQPSWSADSQHLLFVSDLDKYNTNPGVNAYLIEPQVFSLAIDNPNDVQRVAVANYGAGGNRDPAYRPNHPNQAIFTHYAYGTKNEDIIQIKLTDVNAIKNQPGVYTEGVTGQESDPSIALTPAEQQNIQPSFSPDGNMLAYVRRNGEKNALYVMPVAEDVTSDSSNPNSDTNLVQKALMPYQQANLLLEQPLLAQPIWSPSGQSLLFYGYTDHEFDLWIATLEKDGSSGKYSIKGSSVQITKIQGHLDVDSRPFWTP
jgi:hypothetical protein